MEVIKSSAEISTVFERGRRIGTSDLTLIVLRYEKQHGQSGRAAFVAGKKSGNAVWRNRAKRRMRSLCRELGYPIDGYDIVFLAKRSLNDTPYQTLLHRVREAIARSGIK